MSAEPAFELEFEGTAVTADETLRAPAAWPKPSAPPPDRPAEPGVQYLAEFGGADRTGASSAGLLEPQPVLLLPGSSSLLQWSEANLPLSVMAVTTPTVELHATLLQSTADRLRNLQVALSLNKSQLAAVLRVSRPTVYEWLRGHEPSVDKAARVDLLCRLVSAAGVSGSRPLNSLFVHRPLQQDEPPLSDQLAEGELDEQRIGELLQRAMELTRAKRAERHAREERFRALGYVEPTEEEKREALIDSETWRDFSEE